MDRSQVILGANSPISNTRSTRKPLRSSLDRMPSLDCSVSEPRVSNLLNGKIDLFSLETPVMRAGAVGRHVELRGLDAA